MICALCGHDGRGDPMEVHLTHGVAVWLCGAHRAPAFLRRRRGRTFTARLEAVWRATGTATARRLAALDAHRRRMDGPPRRPLPGSYTWPLLRRDAERRFAAGEPPRDVIADLRDRHHGGTAIVPSVRTMRRWFTQARWLTGDPSPTPPRRRQQPRRPSPLLLAMLGLSYTREWPAWTLPNAP